MHWYLGTWLVAAQLAAFLAFWAISLGRQAGRRKKRWRGSLLNCGSPSQFASHSAKLDGRVFGPSEQRVSLVDNGRVEAKQKTKKT